MVESLPYVSRDELLHRLREARARLDDLIARSGNRLDQPGVEGDWSVKDVIGHLLAYEWWIAGQLMPEGHPRFNVPDWVDMDDVDSRNAWFYSLHHDRPVADVLADSRWIFDRLTRGVASRSDEELNRWMRVNANEDLEPVPPGEPAERCWPIWWRVWNLSGEHYEQHFDALVGWADET